MRYYENSYCYGYRHHHYRPNIEVDVFPGWGGSYYQAPVARPEVVVVTQAATYTPMAGGQVMMPQPQPYAAGGMSMGTAGYYQQQQTYQYQQQQQYNNPPYPQW
ncbi:uncharacterized protein LOC6562435 [Drosophila grimshawi]|uniref:GH11532 n=1 Tax=Drosophila grimshawi TaxID=7222 RepID=B4JB67_DROGR|nr:uncharacterized protein LOC6562435 [Drosophila grimshawi]EDW03959.1 GH11532 [Drosophila grimshawi]